MAEYLHPGVYVREVSSGIKPITATATSTAGFIGEAVRGIPAVPHLCTSFDDYVRTLGGHSAGEGGLLAQAVEAFFDAGGRRAYVVRVLPGDADIGTSGGIAVRYEPAVTTLSTTFLAKGAGKWSDAIRIEVSEASNFPDKAFRIDVIWTENGESRTLETYDDVVTDPAHEDYYQDLIENNSKYIECVDEFQVYLDGKGDDDVPVIPAQPPILRAGSGSSDGYRVYEGAKLELRWWDLESGAEIGDPTPIEFTNNALTTAGATVENGYADLDAQQLRDLLFNVLGADPALVIPELADIASGLPEIRVEPSGYTTFGSLRVSISEVLQPTVSPVLRNLGFGASARGYDADSPAHPGVRPKEDIYSIDGGTDGEKNALTVSDFEGDEVARTGFNAFNSVDVQIIAIPGKTTVEYIAAGMSYADQRGDCFYLVDGPGGIAKDYFVLPVDAKGFVEALPTRTNNAAMFYPWIKVPDSTGTGRNPQRFVPPCGHVAGILARTDNTRGVWKAPAGLDAVVTGALDLQYKVDDGEQDILNPVSVNCLRQFPGTGIVTWGSRTLSSDPEWRYVPVRRTGLMLKESLRRGLQWAVFEPNDHDLWDRIRSNVNAFMLSLFRQGAFQGKEPADAFWVKCDATTNPQELIDQGIVTCEVAWAPLKPAEFVVIQISQKTMIS